LNLQVTDLQGFIGFAQKPIDLLAGRARRAFA
jgi:hypothetical protein